MPTIGQLVAQITSSANVSPQAMTAHVRALRKSGLIPHTPEETVTVDHAIWLLLSLLGGSVRRAREIAQLVNSLQTLNDVFLNDGDSEIHVFDGLRDVINFRRTGAGLIAGDFRLAESSEAFSATICTRSAVPDGGEVFWNLAFGRPMALGEPSPALWRLAVASPAMIDDIAGLFGPLAMLTEPLRWVGADQAPPAAAAAYHANTVH